MEQQRYHYYVSRLNDEHTTIMTVNVAISPPPPSLESQHEEIPLWVEVILYDNNVQAAIEDSMQNFKMILATNKVIYTLLKKSTVMTQSECCSICLEELVNNIECYAMSCNPVFHQSSVSSIMYCDLATNKSPSLKGVTDLPSGPGNYIGPALSPKE
ncbi:hypothetical protein CR513_46395, partial [Mucuna pruriens]